jgi:hypothetical protein
MTRRQTFTQAQLRAAARIAKEHGVSVRLDPDGSATISPSSTSASDDELDRELEAFEREHLHEVNQGKEASRRQPERPPKTNAFADMNPNSRKIISGRYIWEYDEFKAHIANQPLNRREIAALEVLSKFGVGAPADFRQIKIGLETRERLEARGYLETRPQEKFPDRVGFYLLTEEGLKVWETRR